MVKRWHKKLKRVKRTLYDTWKDTAESRRAFHTSWVESQKERLKVPLSTLTEDLHKDAVRSAVVDMMRGEVGKIRADVRAELMAECRGESLSIARQELEEGLRHARMKYEEALARHDAEIEQTVDLMVEKREAVIRSEVKSEYEERLEGLAEELALTKERLVDASEALAEIVLQAFECNGPGRRVFPARRLTIKAIDLQKLNRALAYFKARVEAEYIKGSELTVACNVDGEGFAAKPKTAFRLVREPQMGSSAQPHGEAAA